MTDIPARLKLIDIKRTSTIDDMIRKGLNSPCEDVFVVISPQEQVQAGNINILETDEVRYAMAFIGMSYYEGFVKRLYRNYLILDEDNAELHSISLNNWSLHIDFNLWSATGYSRPNGIISLKSNPQQTIEYGVPALKYFQDIWDFFLKIDTEFDDYRSAKRYRESLSSSLGSV